jgi:hypothetical protein
MLKNKTNTSPTLHLSGVERERRLSGGGARRKKEGVGGGGGRMLKTKIFFFVLKDLNLHDESSYGRLRRR